MCLYVFVCLYVSGHVFVYEGVCVYLCVSVILGKLISKEILLLCGLWLYRCGFYSVCPQSYMDTH